MKTANLDGAMEVEEFTLLFKSSREFFFAPVIEYGQLAEWKEIAGSGQEMQDVFWYIKEAIDAYFDGRPFSVTVKAGCLIGKKIDARVSDHSDAEISLDDDLEAFEDELDTSLPEKPEKIAAGSVRVGGGEEISNIVSDADVIDENSPEEQELDAFIEGKKRPSHLDHSVPLDLADLDAAYDDED
jgi:hypothetical protein